MALKFYLTVIIVLQTIFLCLEWILWLSYGKKKDKSLRKKSHKSATLENSTKSQEETSNAEFISVNNSSKDQEYRKKRKISKK